MTEAYVVWGRSFIHLHRLWHPETLGQRDIGAFLAELAVRRGEPLAPQALLLLYLEFLHQELGTLPVQYTPAAGRGLAPKQLLDQMRDVLRPQHSAQATEDA